MVKVQVTSGLNLYFYLGSNPTKGVFFFLSDMIANPEKTFVNVAFDRRLLISCYAECYYISFLHLVLSSCFNFYFYYFNLVFCTYSTANFKNLVISIL